MATIAHLILMLRVSAYPRVETRGDAIMPFKQTLFRRTDSVTLSAVAVNPVWTSLHIYINLHSNLRVNKREVTCNVCLLVHQPSHSRYVGQLRYNILTSRDRPQNLHHRREPRKSATDSTLTHHNMCILHMCGMTTLPLTFNILTFRQVKSLG